VNAWEISRNRGHRWLWCTKGDRMAAQRKSDQRRDDLCADGLRKGVQDSPIAIMAGSFTI
jgi:hypothetical protein